LSSTQVIIALKVPEKVTLRPLQKVQIYVSPQGVIASFPATSGLSLSPFWEISGIRKNAMPEFHGTPDNRGKHET
jgi:hypothetical protein